MIITLYPEEIYCKVFETYNFTYKVIRLYKNTIMKSKRNDNYLLSSAAVLASRNTTIDQTKR